MIEQNQSTAPPLEADDRLKSFASCCKEAGILNKPEELEEQDLGDGLIDSPTLWRFLVARKFDADAALAQLKEARQLREQNDALRLFDILEVSDYEKARQWYPHWTGRRDKNGVPICMFDLSKFVESALPHWEKCRTSPAWRYSASAAESPSPNMLQLSTVYHDSLVRSVLPLCSLAADRPDPTHPIAHSIYLVDASSLGLKQGWGLRTFAQSISSLLSTCYPETIQRVFVCNASSLFATIWKQLSKWVDPHTASKIVVLSPKEVLPTLQEHIEDQHIPKVFGGGFPFQHGMLPDLDDNIRKHFLWEQNDQSFPPGPIKWTKGTDGVRTAWAVGSQDGILRREKLATVVGDK